MTPCASEDYLERRVLAHRADADLPLARNASIEYMTSHDYSSIVRYFAYAPKRRAWPQWMETAEALLMSMSSAIRLGFKGHAGVGM